MTHIEGGAQAATQTAHREPPGVSTYECLCLVQ